MPALSTSRIRRLLAAGDAARTMKARGAAFERLAAYVFGSCPGVRHFQSDILNQAGSSEIDVCFWNRKRRHSLDFLPEILVVECKNTKKRVGSAADRKSCGLAVSDCAVAGPLHPPVSAPNRQTRAGQLRRARKNDCMIQLTDGF